MRLRSLIATAFALLLAAVPAAAQTRVASARSRAHHGPVAAAASGNRQTYFTLPLAPLDPLATNIATVPKPGITSIQVAQGPQGMPGPTGATGATGAQGPDRASPNASMPRTGR